MDLNLEKNLEPDSFSPKSGFRQKVQKVLVMDLEVEKRIADILECSVIRNFRKIKPEVKKDLQSSYQNTYRTLDLGFDEGNSYHPNSKNNKSQKGQAKVLCQN